MDANALSEKDFNKTTQKAGVENPLRCLFFGIKQQFWGQGLKRKYRIS